MMMHGPANVKKQVSSVGLGVAAHSLSLMQKRGLFNKIIYIYVYIYIYMYIYIYIYIYPKEIRCCHSGVAEDSSLLECYVVHFLTCTTRVGKLLH